jgi:hypothetical protein
MESAQSAPLPLDPFPLLTLPDLVLQHILQHLTPKERKATRGTCRKLCKVASDSGTNPKQPMCLYYLLSLQPTSLHRLCAGLVL